VGFLLVIGGLLVYMWMKAGKKLFRKGMIIAVVHVKTALLPERW
jgi:hypothetical protein